MNKTKTLYNVCYIKPTMNFYEESMQPPSFKDFSSIASADVNTPNAFQRFAIGFKNLVVQIFEVLKQYAPGIYNNIKILVLFVYRVLSVIFNFLSMNSLLNYIIPSILILAIGSYIYTNRNRNAKPPQTRDENDTRSIDELYNKYLQMDTKWHHRG